MRPADALRLVPRASAGGHAGASIIRGEAVAARPGRIIPPDAVRRDGAAL